MPNQIRCELVVDKYSNASSIWIGRRAISSFGAFNSRFRFFAQLTINFAMTNYFLHGQLLCQRGIILLKVNILSKVNYFVTGELFFNDPLFF